MERFSGLAILASNRKGDLDEAFIRRLRFIVDFVPPGPAERERLWRLCLEGSTDAHGRSLTGDIDYAALGQEIDLTGAGIKSAAIAAAFLARSDGTAIGLRHVRAAAARELGKQGILLRDAARTKR
jgi:SpoVK/Ycf46/Vps4 family AAA+-type ATPase